jgi:hypothetical protein
MAEINTSTSLEELAAIVSQALEAVGILATLSGGAAVSIYTNNRYQSEDLDFVSSADGFLPIHKPHGCLSFQPAHWDSERRSSMLREFRRSIPWLARCV